MPLLKPLSCHAIAEASEGETPYCAATDWMSPAPTRVGVGCGPAAGTTRWLGSGSEARAGVGAPAGRFSTRPISRGWGGARAFGAPHPTRDTPAVGGGAPRRRPGGAAEGAGPAG